MQHVIAAGDSRSVLDVLVRIEGSIYAIIIPSTLPKLDRDGCMQTFLSLLVSHRHSIGQLLHFLNKLGLVAVLSLQCQSVALHDIRSSCT